MSEEDDSHVGFYKSDFQISNVTENGETLIFTAHLKKDGSLLRQGRYEVSSKVSLSHLWKVAAELRLYPYLQEDLGDDQC